MRLINTRAYKLEYFLDSEIPDYAILSHTWGTEEVTFQDITAAGDGELLRGKRGFMKIVNVCQQAFRDGFQYVWVDTCCIDKSDSTELSEAINSMFRYYQKARVCYAVLEDLSRSYFSLPVALKSCRWFSRGWTLQELLASDKLVFFDSGWEYLDTKAGLAGIISDITGIPVGTLRDSALIRTHSIARRMSWAAHRKTTRAEDMAYCLLGIFGVNMPFLYGEGDRAFQRLQEEIIKIDSDHSILAWEDVETQGTHFQDDFILSGPLAPHPKAFAAAGSVVTIPQSHGHPHQMTNRGLSIFLHLIPDDQGSTSNPLKRKRGHQNNQFKYLGILSCHYEDDFSGHIAVSFVRNGNSGDCYRIVNKPLLVQPDVNLDTTLHSQIIIANNIQEIERRRRLVVDTLWVKSSTAKSHGYVLTETAFSPSEKFSYYPRTQTLKLQTQPRIARSAFAAFLFHEAEKNNGFIALVHIQGPFERTQVTCFAETKNKSLKQWLDSFLESKDASNQEEDLPPDSSALEISTKELDLPFQYLVTISMHIQKKFVMSREIAVLEVGMRGHQ